MADSQSVDIVSTLQNAVIQRIESAEIQPTGPMTPVDWDIADLNRDGRSELIHRRRDGLRATTIELEELESWRRLGCWQPAADLNGDGTDDLISMPTLAGDLSYQRFLGAVSGANGEVLWDYVTEAAQAICLSSDDGDIDDDGASDVLLLEAESLAVNKDRRGDDPNELKITALSGADGSRIWTLESQIQESHGDSAPGTDKSGT